MLFAGHHAPPWLSPLGPQAARFVQANLYDEASGELRRSFMRGPSAVAGFADDYGGWCRGKGGGPLPMTEFVCALGFTLHGQKEDLSCLPCPLVLHPAAYMIQGLLELYAATGGIQHLEVRPPA